ncbi:MAG: TonB-dependent receptor [Gemmatimonadota bacterium]
MRIQLARVASLLTLVLLAFVPTAQTQQTTGRISGTVTAQDGQAVTGAYIAVVGTRHSAVTGRDGRFVIANVAAGSYTLRITHVAFKEATVADVAVAAGSDAALAPTLEEQPVSLDEVVASASRGAQKITEAPATVTKINADVIANSVGNSFSGALKEAKGIDFIQVGVTAVAINARGFNSSFNNRMLMMEDGRIAVLPENGLPVGTFTTIPKLDLASVEVLIGPGSALYGADASNGVITLTTKDPRQYPGMSFEVSGGNRSYIDLQGRAAGVTGNWGYKVTGEHQSADDWSNELRYGVTATNPGRLETGAGGAVDWTSRVTRGNGSVFYYMGDAQLEATVGMSVSDGVGQTNVGRNQLDDWKYNVAQLKYTSPRWYASVYRTQSQAGQSYALNRFTDNKAANPSKSDEELRLMSDWPSDGQMYAAELQGNFVVPQLKSRLVLGTQFRNDIVSSDRQWLTDRLTGEDLAINQKGVYGQVDAQLHSMLNLVAAVRYDDHENYDAQFSPKVGLVFKPAEGQAARVTYNRAFKSPTTLQTNFFIPDFAPVVVAGHWIGVHGNTRGFIVKNAAGATVTTYEPLKPEENTTWELGYKAVFGDRLMLDVAGYRAKYDNFLSPLSVISNSLAGQTAYFADNDERVDNATARQLVLTYFNIGQAKLQGIDAGFKWLLNKNVDVSGTVSHTELTALDTAGTATAAQKAEATSLNSPVLKWTLGAHAENIFRNFGAGLTARHVTGYRFRSGINNSWVPTFNTVDLNFSFAVPALGAHVNAAVINAFTCKSKYTYEDAPRQFEVKESNNICGFKRHQEMVNMPSIGTMFFLGVRYNR